VPSIVVPFGVDQPFWGSRVERLGAGPKPIPRAKLTEQRLADALARTVTDEAMRARAAELGETLRGEDGVASAVAIFDRMASSVRSRRRAESATPL
jgi:UDP:flavonoid glycosyltransferase YjiC (YdhE family)